MPMKEISGTAAGSFHRRYLALVEEIERTFRVDRWKAGDVEIWPLARMDLYDDMYCAAVGGYPPESRPPPVLLRTVARIATPLTNAWKSRRDLAHWVGFPKPAHAILLGDGVSLDRVDNAWQDRYGEALIAALERRGLSTFLMQSGDLRRLPWHRPTFGANVVAAYGSLTASAYSLAIEMPQHEHLLRYLADHGVNSPSLDRARLIRRARVVFASACAFERLLRVVRPALAFVVTYYAGLGPAFLVACRRQGILSVDLQHCPQEGNHKAYGWSVLPVDGYATLPAVFWNWTEEDAGDIRRWTSRLRLPWHRSLYGGHTQIAPFLDDDNPVIRVWDERFLAVANGAIFEREILIALQPIGGQRARWDALARQIEAAPRNWRWWVRRHPASRAYQDVEYQALLDLRMPNVDVEAASSLPLPVLLRHTSVLVSLASGAAAEAASFGVPALFLSEAAGEIFARLIARKLATLIDVRSVNRFIEALPSRPHRPARSDQPDLDQTLHYLQRLANDYPSLRHSPGAAAP